MMHSDLRDPSTPIVPVAAIFVPPPRIAALIYATILQSCRKRRDGLYVGGFGCGRDKQRAMEGSPVVTVVVPAYQAAATLARALDFILVQSGLPSDVGPLDIVVVDDVSSDATAEIAESYAAHGVRLIRRATRGGAAAARNDGIAAAGEMVAFLDADDEWCPGKLAKQIAVLRSDPRIVFVSCGSVLIDPNGRLIGPLYDDDIPIAGDQAWRGLLARNTIATPSVLAWRRALLDVGGFNPALRVAEDQDMWIRLSIHGHLGYVDEPLVRVHATPNSLSSGNVHEQVAVTLPVVERYIALKQAELTPDEIRSIRGGRWGRLGRNAYSQELYVDGLRIIGRAMRYGDRPLYNVLFLLNGAPPMRWLKRHLRERIQASTSPRTT